MEELLEFISLLLSERSFKLDCLQIFVFVLGLGDSAWSFCVDHTISKTQILMGLMWKRRLDSTNMNYVFNEF